MHKKPTTPPPQSGSYEEHFKDGTVAVSGHYADGMKTGEWKYFYLSNGQVKAVGAFVADKMHGQWTWYREGGELQQTGGFEHGVRSGVWRRHHLNGLVADEGSFMGDKKTGEWRTYDEKGVLTKIKKHTAR